MCAVYMCTCFQMFLLFSDILGTFFCENEKKKKDGSYNALF